MSSFVPKFTVKFMSTMLVEKLPKTTKTIEMYAEMLSNIRLDEIIEIDLSIPTVGIPMMDGSRCAKKTM
tara:strand:- start:314 stop:520 length:207 start_codon:yes stop_codon:yes gene_type:complete